VTHGDCSSKILVSPYKTTKCPNPDHNLISNMHVDSIQILVSKMDDVSPSPDWDASVDFIIGLQKYVFSPP
jgi:hypothetical protein